MTPESIKMIICDSFCKFNGQNNQFENLGVKLMKRAKIEGEKLTYVNFIKTCYLLASVYMKKCILYWCADQFPNVQNSFMVMLIFKLMKIG